MDSNQFIQWLRGFAEINQVPPNSEQWEVIKQKLAETSEVMTPLENTWPNYNPWWGITPPPGRYGDDTGTFTEGSWVNICSSCGHNETGKIPATSTYSNEEEVKAEDIIEAIKCADSMRAELRDLANDIWTTGILNLTNSNVPPGYYC